MATVAEAGVSLVIPNAAYSTDLTIGLHPLAILNISDFYTRAHLSRTDLLGGLIGKQTGRDVSIEHTFEFRLADGQIDEDLLNKKLEQFKACFEDLDFVGWFYIPLQLPYEPTEELIPVHQYLAKFHNDTPPLLLILNPSAEAVMNTQSLPITIYETLFTETGKPQFVEVQHRIDSFEAEHIGVLYVAKQDAVVTAEKKDTTESSLAGRGKAKEKMKKDEAADTMTSSNAEEIVSQLNSQANAVKMLHSRLQILQQYLDYVQSLPDEAVSVADLEVLRQIDGLVGRLSTENFGDVAQGQQIDGLLAALLGLVTKGVKYGVELNAKRQMLDVQRGPAAAASTGPPIMTERLSRYYGRS
ncbi:hypothetical protein POJ06DRAFT_26039 [Lipomyces tetrasporus]|uniref:COP9 signalosome complex subunit 6 n=1 Tax=Lipomyces tetrasporus TaxID=54092 RepID=A0AAD7QMH1_9ASCO|nr:uncharacterized protein POJ06DRAFT_26039 [Lipomyces tetrasporus]KAJ8097969.1 hypothetical protein POJ06DRAFT_26039 [Lipomyces tetrasporus]